MLAELGLAGAVLAGAVGAATLESAAAIAPVEGQAITLRFVADGRPAAGLEVEAKYRENAHASLQSTQAVGTTGADGTVSWTPEKPGVVALTWEGGSSHVAVRHDGTPLSGLLIALLAGVLLLGGSIVFFLQMLRAKELPEETHRFDT